MGECTSLNQLLAPTKVQARIPLLQPKFKRPPPVRLPLDPGFRCRRTNHTRSGILRTLGRRGSTTEFLRVQPNWSKSTICSFSYKTQFRRKWNVTSQSREFPSTKGLPRSQASDAPYTSTDLARPKESEGLSGINYLIRCNSHRCRCVVMPTSGAWLVNSPLHDREPNARIASP